MASRKLQEPRVGLGTFGTFGNPDGFLATFYDPDTQFTKGLLDLDPYAIELNLESELFAVKREIQGDAYRICFCAYTYARERKSSRGGAFIGSCIVFQNGICDGRRIYACLRAFHNDLTTNRANVADGVLQVDQPRDFEVREPSGFEELQAHVKLTKAILPVDSVVNNQSVLIHESGLSGKKTEDPVERFFRDAIDNHRSTRSVYFTLDSTLIRYVESKGLIPVIVYGSGENGGWTKGQSSVQPQKRNEPEFKDGGARSAKLFPFDVVDEIRRMIEAYNDLVEKHNDLLERHSKLVESNTGLARRCDELEGRCLRLESAHGSLAEGGRAQRAGANRDKHQPVRGAAPFWTDSRVKGARIAVITVAGLLVCFLAYVCFFGSGSNGGPQEGVSAENKSASAKTSREPLSSYTPLSPVPNGDLKESDLKRLIDHLKLGMTSVEIVEWAFAQDLGGVGRVYGNQRDMYARTLVEQNGSCFDKDSKIISTDLRRFPIYKQP